MNKSGMIKTLCACTMLLVLMVSQAQTEEKPVIKGPLMGRTGIDRRTEGETQGAASGN